VKQKLPWAVCVVLVACAIAVAIQMWNRRAENARLPDFHLVERSGREVSRRSLLGQVWVADFVFLKCTWSCPKMYSAMDALLQRVPEARYVSFSVDPEHDTPEFMAKTLPTLGIDKEAWYWLSGASREEMQRIALGFMRPASTGEEIVHSERFFLVDRYGRIRASYPVLLVETLADGKLVVRRDEAVLKQLEEDLRKLLSEPYLPVARLPAANAMMNSTTFVLLVTGLCFIKAKKIGAHKAAMLGALTVSGLFLVSYLTAHYFLGSTPYPHHDWRRPVYFTILISHTILAGVVAVLAPVTVYRAFRDQIDRHRRLAKVTLPMWLYVSVTGVVIYFMLY
jgi:protein SCO1/2